MQSPPKGVIYDQGYRTYEGRYGGRGQALWTMVWSDFQRALGLKKSWRYKLGVGVLVGFIVLPMLILLMFSLLPTGEAFPSFFQNPFSGYFDWINRFVLILSAMIAADLLCNDRRYRVVPLYLARPIQRYDYILAKFLAICGFLLTVSLIPVLAMFGIKLFLAQDSGQFLSEHSRDLSALILSSFLYSIFYGSFSMAISSLTVSRGYATGGAIGLGILSGIVALLLFEATQNRYLFYLVNFEAIVAGVKNVLFGTAQAIPIPVIARGLVNVDPLDPWVYWLAFVAVVTACGLVVYSVYRREGV